MLNLAQSTSRRHLPIGDPVRVCNILLVSHRFPYPPDRGEKIRLWHILRHLARSHRVFMGCLLDDERDWQFVAQVEAFCAELGCFGIDKRRQKLRALAGFRPGRPLMLDYYGSRDLRRWVKGIAARVPIDLVYIYSAAMAPYALDLTVPRRILDMQDIELREMGRLCAQIRMASATCLVAGGPYVARL